MTFNIDISPDDERILNDILDKGLYDFRTFLYINILFL